jgi:serine/threonine-protein kinase
MVGAPEPITARRPGVPPDLAALVMRCLEQRPADRPQSADELLATLETVRTASGSGTPMGAAPAAPRPRGRRLATIAGAALALAAAGGAAALLARRGAPTLDPKRVAVAPFDNQTGDPALDPLGRMAADWLTQGLTQTQLLDVVPSSSTLYSGPSGALGGAGATSAVADRLGALAEATGAGTLVSGAYYRQGDSVRFQAQVTRVSDAHRSTVLRAIEPVSGPLAQPTEAVERLRQRVTAQLAALLDPKLSGMAWNTIEPPTYEAYRAFMLGLERFYRLEYPETITHLTRAAALDSSESQSTANQALLWAAVAYNNLGRYAEADLVAGVVAARGERVAPLERHLLDVVRAGLRGDWAASPARSPSPDAARRRGPWSNASPERSRTIRTTSGTSACRRRGEATARVPNESRRSSTRSRSPTCAAGIPSGGSASPPHWASGSARWRFSGTRSSRARATTPSSTRSSTSSRFATTHRSGSCCGPRGDRPARRR